MSSVIGDRMTSIAQTIERQLDDAITPLVLGEGLKGWSKKISPDGEKVTVGALVHLAILNDALVVAEKAMMQDGVVTAEEKAYITPLARTAVRYLGRFRSFYEEFSHGLDDVKDFLEVHMSDSHPFGGKCIDTRWTGAQICRNFAISADDDGPLVDYRDAMGRLVDDIFELTKDGDPTWQKDLRDEISLKSRLEPSDTKDGRMAAFCSPSAGSVFHAVAHAEEVFERDPLDVEAIHAEARDAFVRTLQRVTAVNRPSRHGAMLLIRGESGAGKTHLMRAFREHVHEARLGHVGYVQMTSASGSYTRHILTSLIDSLEKPFLSGEPSSLTGIADWLMRWRVPEQLEVRLREEAEPSARAHLVGQIVDHLVAQKELSGIDVDLIRAFIYLATNDAVVGARAKRYLRCEQLSDYDRQHLGGMTPSADDNAPLRMIVGIGKLIAASHGGALVLLVDQLEDVYEVEPAKARFRNLMDALRQIAELVPTSLAVIACLHDFYETLRGSLVQSVLDRLERDPAPVHIVTTRTRDEVELLVSTRLRLLFEQQGARIRNEEPIWPFTSEHIAALTGLRTRDVLDWCRTAHERCVEAGRIVSFTGIPGSGAAVAAPPAATKSLSNEWAVHVAGFRGPTTDDELSALLPWSIRQAGREANAEVAVTTTNGLEVTLGSGPSAKRSVIALCNAAPQGGALARQVDALVQRAAKSDARVVIVRCLDYPTTAKSAIAQKIGAVLKSGGAKTIARDTDWRTLAALRAFVEEHEASPDLDAWLREERVVARLELMKAILGDELPRRAKTASVAAPPAAPPLPAAPSLSAPPLAIAPAGVASGPASLAAPPSHGGTRSGPIVIGRTRSLSPVEVTRDPMAFMRHAAFLGSTGSGKTTLALNVVEQCLLQGVPVLLVDRKGDLCRYGSESFWNEPEADPQRAERKRLLRERVRVQIFTPGEHRGRPLALPVVPPGLGELAVAERVAMASSAAAGLASMMGYKSSQQDAARQAILAKAIEIIAQLGGKSELGLSQLIDLIADEDPALVDAIGKLDTKHFKALVDHLATLRLRYEMLLKGGELLNAELLFGMGSFATPAKTALSIVSTKFLPDAGVVDFWVSRLLIELTRWSSRHPAGRLQALVMLDEADIYLPAQTKPATKQPMQDLLKRARSAGVGVFLATQSPGDLDYKCRDNVTSWFLGKISEKTALDKMKPLLSDYRSNPAGKLAGAQQGEFFVLADGNVTELKAERSIMNTLQLPEDEIIGAARAPNA